MTPVAEPTKIDFRHRRVRELGDVTDLVEMLFPANVNQQHAAARILVELRRSGGIIPTLKPVGDRYGISRRTIERARAKLARLGLIEHVSRFNRRHHGQEGWRLSTRFSGGLRALAGWVDTWAADRSPRRAEKEQALVRLLDHRRQPPANE